MLLHEGVHAQKLFGAPVLGRRRTGSPWQARCLPVCPVLGAQPSFASTAHHASSPLRTEECHNSVWNVHGILPWAKLASEQVSYSFKLETVGFFHSVRIGLMDMDGQANSSTKGFGSSIFFWPGFGAGRRSNS